MSFTKYCAPIIIQQVLPTAVLYSKTFIHVHPAVALHHPSFFVNPVSVTSYSLHTSSSTGLFSCSVNKMLMNLAGHKYTKVMIHYLEVQSCPIMLGLSKVMFASVDIQLLVEKSLMVLPNPSLCIVGFWSTRTTVVVLDCYSKAKCAHKHT